MICNVCNNENNNAKYIVREMMFGFRDEFEYFQCSNCKCLQIASVPNDLDKYYPNNYYSFVNVKRKIKQKKVKFFLYSQHTKYVLGKRTVLGFLVSVFLSKHRKKLKLLLPCNLSLESKILDIGCGAGRYLLKLKELGFINLTGVDPFVRDDIFYSNGVKIYKKSIYDVNDTFDLVMMHHSFEHMENPNQVFAHIFKILSNNGYLLIRIPTVSSYAWRHYKENWVQIDAPRHLFLHSIDSIKYLALKHGFLVNSVNYDSGLLQFVGSEQYLKDIPLKAENSYCINSSKSFFSDADILQFKEKAKILNRNNDGDSVAILLSKKND